MVDGLHDPVLGPAHEVSGGPPRARRRRRSPARRVGHRRRRGRAGRRAGRTRSGAPWRTPRHGTRWPGTAASSLPFWRPPEARGEVRPHLLERVELAVVVLHRVHVVVGAAADEIEPRPVPRRPRQRLPHRSAPSPIQQDPPGGRHRGRRARHRVDPASRAGARAVQGARRGRMSSGMSPRRGLPWSRSERMGSPMPQSAPTAGSSQASPSSSEGS